jgi:hypothetical protein
VVTGARLHRYTYREYLNLEQAANVRHEFFDGEIDAIAGGTREHAAICANITTALSVQLRGRGCQAHSSDLRVRVLETGLATYPDVTVVCNRAELDPDDRDTITNLEPAHGTLAAGAALKVLAKDMPEQPGPRFSAELAAAALVVAEELELHHTAKRGRDVGMGHDLAPSLWCELSTPW